MQFNLSLGKQMFVFIVKLVWSKSWRKRVDGKKSAKKSRRKKSGEKTHSETWKMHR